MPTTVVNKRSAPYDTYIGRGSIFGNPWTHHQSKGLAEHVVATREEAIAKYKEYFLKRVEEDHDFRMQVLALCKDKVLGCYCKPLSCHGDIIAEWVDKNWIEPM